MGCALASIDHSYTGALPLNPRDNGRPKVDFGWVKTLALFFSVCGPKFTKLSVHVWEWL